MFVHVAGEKLLTARWCLKHSEIFRAPEHVQSRSSESIQWWMSGEDGVEITKRHRFGSWPVETAADCGWRYAYRCRGSQLQGKRHRCICQWYANCLAHLMVAREMERRAIVSEMIAIHPGVIRSQFMKPKNCCEGCIMNCCDCSRINVVAGAQSSIHAATCPSTDLREEIIYFHSNYGQYGCYVLKPNDLAMVESRCQALFDECDFCCAISPGEAFLADCVTVKHWVSACFCTKSEDFCQKRSGADW